MCMSAEAARNQTNVPQSLHTGRVPTKLVELRAWAIRANLVDIENRPSADLIGRELIFQSRPHY